MSTIRFPVIVLCFFMASAFRTMGSAAEPIVPKNKPINLLENNLERFYSYLQDYKYDDPKKVFVSREDGLQITGEVWGYLATKDEYANYHMVCEFKWGKRTWGSRQDRARDSGLLVHCTGPDGGFGGTWMSSIEAQIIEGGVGDFLVLSGKDEAGKEIPYTLSAKVSKDRDGETVWDPKGEEQAFRRGRINWQFRDPDWADKIAFRGAKDVESPFGEWNVYEVICNGDQIVNKVNGIVVNKGFKVSPAAGKILIQSEGAELFVRKWELRPLSSTP